MSGIRRRRGSFRTARPALVGLVLASFLLAGCESLQALDDTAGQMADTLAPADPVTGERTAHFASRESEIELGRRYEAGLLEDCRASDVPADVDAEALSRLRRMLSRITSVCHRPDLPWRIHLVESNEWNAFATAGGLVVVLRGLYDSLPEDHLAGVIGHEVAHVCCRHITESQAHDLLSLVSKKTRRAASDPWYRASYGTKQEDEADRVGLLYTALAGYDPNAVPELWAAMHERYGSDPAAGNWLHGHSLSIDRAKKTAQLAPVASRYYAGPGIVNPDAARILRHNEVAPRAEPTDSGLVELARAVADTLKVVAEARMEAETRRRKAKAEPYLRTARLQAQVGNFEGAWSTYRRATEVDPGSIEAWYNMACIAAVYGERDNAIACLANAAQVGFDDADYAARDPDLAALHGDPRFLRILELMRR